MFTGCVAQWRERSFPKRKVAGSTPASFMMILLVTGPPALAQARKASLVFLAGCEDMLHCTRHDRIHAATATAHKFMRTIDRVAAIFGIFVGRKGLPDASAACSSLRACRRASALSWSGSA